MFQARIKNTKGTTNSVKCFIAQMPDGDNFLFSVMKRCANNAAIQTQILQAVKTQGLAGKYYFITQLKQWLINEHYST
jgi:hypothetical protein